MLMSEGEPGRTYTDEVLILLANQPIVLCMNSSKAIYAERLNSARPPDACFWQMHIGSLGLAFSPKSGKASDLLALDFLNETTHRTKAANGRFWRKPATWRIETLNDKANIHVQSTPNALLSNSRGRRFAPIPAWEINEKMKEAAQVCRALTARLRLEANLLLKPATMTRQRLLYLAAWLSRPAEIKSSAERQTGRFHQTIIYGLNNVVNTTYQLVAAERRKKRLAAEGRHQQPSIPSSSWSRRPKSSFEEHIRTRAELSGLLYELRRERRVAVFDLYRTVQSRLNWSEERQRAWLINGTLPAFIEELHTPRLQGRSFADEELYAAQHYLRNYIRLSGHASKLPTGKNYDILVNRTMTVILEDKFSRGEENIAGPKCEFTNYGD